MNYLRNHVRESRAVLALAVLMPLALAVSSTSLAVKADAATPSHPACQASRITVTTGSTETNTTYPVRTSTGVHQELALEIVPVYFYNRGTTCHLLMGAPIFRAVRNTTDVAHFAAHDLSVPAGADNTRRPVVARHQKLEALFVIVKAAGSPFKGCAAATTTGFLVGNYANPIATSHFVLRRLHDVCFDTGARRIVLNYGVGWPTT